MFKKYCIGFFNFTFIILTNIGFAQTVKWEQVGLSGGHVVYLAVDPNNSGVVYAGTWDGLYKSTNGGDSWYSKNSGLPSKSVESIAIDPSNSNVVYVGLWDGGLYRSSSSGSSWYKRSTGLTDTYVMALAINPQNTSTIYAGTAVGSGIFKSTNSASSWTVKNSGLTHMGVVTIAIKPSSPSTIFIGTEGGGVFRSLTSGSYWYSKNSGLGNTNVQGLVIDPSNNSTIYAATHGGVYKSTNSGASWTSKNSGITNYELKAIAISESDPDILYVGSWGSGIYKTTNGGASWTRINTGLGNYTVVSLAVDPTNPEIVYAGTWGSGVYKTKNTAPQTPILSSPSDEYYTNNNSPVLTWNVPDDDDGDALHFKVEIDASGIWSYVDRTIESKTSTTGFLPTPPVSEGSGQVSYTVQSSLSDGDWWWRVSAWDGSQYGLVSSVRKLYIDTSDPYTTGHSPSKYATDVPYDATLSFHVKDNLSGVGSSSITLKINGQTKTPVITGSPSDYTVMYTPAGGFPYEQTIAVTIDASDRAGNLLDTDSYSFTTEEAPDQEAPVLAHTAVTSSPLGSPVEITANVTDNLIVAAVQLYYRMGGDQDFITSNMSLISGSTYISSIPSQYVTERGLEYYIFTLDGVGNQTTSPSFNPATSPHIIQCTYESFACPISLPEQAYRMISVPGDLNDSSPDAVLEDDLGKHRRSKWRLIHDAGDEYQEHGKQDILFEPGYGFWAVTKEAGVWDVGAGQSVSTGSYYTISLKPGWTQIGNPFAFPVNWSDVILNGNVEGLVAYSGESNETTGYLYNQSILEPWQGYYVKNLESDIVTLHIPPVSSDNSLSKVLTNLENTSGWILQLSAQCGNSADHQNYLGCLENADEKWDPNDFSEAPPFGDFVSLTFPHEDWSRYPGIYTADFRPISDKGHTWHLDLKTNISDKPVELILKQIEFVPENFDVVLRDMSSGKQVKLEGGSETFILPRGVHHYELQLMAGTQSFIDENIRDNQVPDICQLVQNYPNPFNASTMISYTLRRPGHVILEVQNVLGQEINTLVHTYQSEGTYSVRWNSRDSYGIYMPTGTYVLSLKVGKHRKIRKIVILR